MVVLICDISDRKYAFPFKSIVYFVEWFSAYPMVQELIFLHKFEFSVSTNEWKVEAVKDKSAKGRLFKIKLSIRKWEKRCKNLLIILLWFRGNAIYDFFLLFLGHRLFPLLFSKKSNDKSTVTQHSFWNCHSEWTIISALNSCKWGIPYVWTSLLRRDFSFCSSQIRLFDAC